jgi:hypothetical protein
MSRVEEISALVRDNGTFVVDTFEDIPKWALKFVENVTQKKRQLRESEDAEKQKIEQNGEMPSGSASSSQESSQASILKNRVSELIRNKFKIIININNKCMWYEPDHIPMYFTMDFYGAITWQVVRRYNEIPSRPEHLAVMKNLISIER